MSCVTFSGKHKFKALIYKTKFNGNEIALKLFGMKRFFFFISLALASVCNAQQNFINVPSSEATKPRKLFFQQQINFNELIQSNTTLDYGLGRGFEIGMNVLGLNFNQKQKSFLNNDTSDVDPFNPLISINGLKQFKLNEKTAIACGAQLGRNSWKDKDVFDAALFYSNILINNVLIKESKLVGGAYYNTKHYGGRGNRFGGWVATELPIIEKIHFMAESIFGNNAICYTSLGFIYYPSPHLPLTFGFQIPNTRRNAYAFVFELTYVP